MIIIIIVFMITVVSMTIFVIILTIDILKSYDYNHDHDMTIVWIILGTDIQILCITPIPRTSMPPMQQEQGYQISNSSNPIHKSTNNIHGVS